MTYLSLNYKFKDQVITGCWVERQNNLLLWYTKEILVKGGAKGSRERQVEGHD